MSMRSVMSGMLRRSSAVRIGPSESRHRMVPFQRPSTTERAASIGHSPISFFDTATVHLLVIMLTNLSVPCYLSA
ncbi:hypothetical protein A7G45_12130 [Mycolicibacterium llatzerense]|nr:hypothetical protein [Mycolicibacterium llatzerense]